MGIYGDGHPRQGHRTPSEVAEEEILAALRGETYPGDAGRKWTQFKTEDPSANLKRAVATPVAH